MSANPITQSAPRKKKVKSAKEDPTEGDGRRWATGAKFDFLTTRLPLWHDARDGGEMSTFYSRLTLMFIRHFTWDRALDADGNGPAEEPSEDDLQQVLDVKGLEDQEIARRNTIYLELRSVRVPSFLSRPACADLQSRSCSDGSATMGLNR